MVNCALCGLPTAHPLPDEAGTAFCCPACREVSALLAAGGPSELARSETGQSRIDRASELARSETGQSQIDRATAEPNALRNTQYVSTTLSLGGMWCASCSWLIGETLERAPGVQSAEISFVQRQARVTFDPARTSLRQLTRRVRGLGYRAWGPGEKPYDEEDALWTRLLICGVLVLHEMLASFAIYGRDWLGISSADTEWLVNFFNWMGLLVAVPVIFLLGLPVIRAGAASLVRGRPNIHTLIALGAVAAFALSMRNLLAGHGRVYFETSSVLLFLVGIGHWLELRAQKTGTEAVDQLFRQIPTEASVVTAAGEAQLPVEQLRPGMRVRVRPGEHFPTDGLIAEGRGDVDESLLTGEPDPLLRTPGERVLAGTANLDGAFDVITTAVGAETVAGQIGKLLHGALWQRAPIERLADRLAAWMVPGAVALALATFAFWGWQAGLETGLVNALSVLLIACPCALGIATPLTLWVGLGRAAEAGIILRSTAALEGLAAVRHAFFDKTGTLTRQPIRLQAVNTNGSAPADFLARIAAIENLSEHPLARAIVAGIRDQEAGDRSQGSGVRSQESEGRGQEAEHVRATGGSGLEALAGHASPPAQLLVTNFRALPGRGVTAEVDGSLIAVGSRHLMTEQGLTLPGELAGQAAHWQTDGLSVVYAGWDGRVRGVLGLGEEVRPEVAATLHEIAGLKIGVTVLTGDDATAGQRWQQILGVPVLAEQRPEDKLAVLRAAGAGVLMVGDGINDGPALAAATVGIGLAHGADVAQSAAEVILLHDDLRAIPWLIALARQALGKVRQNLAWAFVYNLVGLILAVTGHMQPAIAALLMVANSALVTWNGLRLRKLIGEEAREIED